jgi:hypothetical protein
VMMSKEEGNGPEIMIFSERGRARTCNQWLKRPLLLGSVAWQQQMHMRK